jgi:hypothetical protein
MFSQNNLIDFPFCLHNFISFCLALFVMILHQIYPSMATFCVDGWSELTILVDGINTTMVFALCLCVMFSF